MVLGKFSKSRHPTNLDKGKGLLRSQKVQVGLFGHFSSYLFSFYLFGGGGRVVRRCWVNFQCRGVLLIWIIVGQGPIALAVGAGGGCLEIFSLIYHFSFLSPSLWETTRYRLKYCLKGPLNSKQPTNQSTSFGNGPI